MLNNDTIWLVPYNYKGALFEFEQDKTRDVHTFHYIIVSHTTVAGALVFWEVYFIAQLNSHEVIKYMYVRTSSKVCSVDS